LVDILEQLISGEIVTLLYDARQPPIIELYLLFFAALAAEPESDRASGNLDVLVAQRCQE
jgi:hypothetical protein